MTNLCVCTRLPLEGHTGAVDRITNLVNYVSKDDVEVYLINRSLEKSLFSIAVDNDKYYQIKSGLTSERQYPLRVRLIFPGPIKIIQEIVNKMVGFLTFTILSEVCLAFLLDPYLIVKLFFVCKKEKIDIIQCEFPETVPSSFIVKKILNVPLVYDSHNVETERMKSMGNVSGFYAAITKIIEKSSCFLCDSIFAVSERDKEEMVSWGISKKKIEIVPNSVEIQKYSALTEENRIRNQYNLADKNVIIFHGDFLYPPNEEACQILANTILPQILKKHSQTYLLLVGRNPPKMSHPNIITTGFVENLAEYISAADIAVVPLLKGGGTRIKIIQYMASGKAVVSTKKGAEGLTIQNGKDILITNSPDSEFISLIITLIENKELRKEIGANAKKKAESLYDWEKTAKKAVQIYSNLVGT